MGIYTQTQLKTRRTQRVYPNDNKEITANMLGGFLDDIIDTMFGSFGRFGSSNIWTGVNRFNQSVDLNIGDGVGGNITIDATDINVGYARGLRFRDVNGNITATIGAFGTTNGFSRLYIGDAWNGDNRVDWFPDGRFQIRKNLVVGVSREDRLGFLSHTRGEFFERLIIRNPNETASIDLVRSSSMDFGSSGYRDFRLQSSVGYFSIRSSSTNSDAENGNVHQIFQLYRNGFMVVNNEETSDENKRIFELNSDGRLRIKGDMISGYNFSDIKLKKDITELSSTINIFNELKPITYRWNEYATKMNSNLESDTINYGLIAQDVEKILPSFVIDDMGGDGDIKGVKYEKFIPLLISAVKDLNNMIKVKDDKINELLDDVALIKSKISSNLDE